MSEELPDHADVVVVGAGPSGSVTAYELAKRGLKVVVLEQGDWVSPAQYPANFDEWELLIQRRWAHDPNIRRFPADYPLDVSDSDMSPVMHCGVGGSSLFYGAEWPRLMPSDFRVRTMDGLCDDWPISYDDVAPYYAEIDRHIGVSGLGGDPAYPEGLDYSQPPLPIGKVGRKAAEGLNKLGWHWWPGSNAIPSWKHRHLEGCARIGTCEWGCPQGAKASFDLAFMIDAVASGASLVTGARVSRVTLDNRGRVDGVTWYDQDANVQRQRANSVVMCANAIGTSRLLLASATNEHPDGLGNSSGKVGKNLMLHPNCSVAGYYDEDLSSTHGPAGQMVYSMQFYETDRSRGFARGSKLHVLPIPGPLSTVETHRMRTFDQLWGQPVHAVLSRHSSGILWAANTEDLPEESNQITLDPVLVDGNGIPAPKVEYRISEDTERNLKFTVDRMQEIHDASGAIETFPVDLWVDQPGHLLGTARMGEDPNLSVVDAFGRSHDIPNLFIADGSIFVTSGSANPTATIAALALRVARHIADTARDGRATA